MGRRSVLAFACVVALAAVVSACSASVSGRVSSETSHKPVVGALVSIAGQSARTLADGSYALKSVKTGSRTLIVSANGFARFSTQMVVKRGANALDLVLQDGAVSGTVDELSTTPHPLSGAAVTLAGSTTTTDSSGSFQLTGVPIGSQELRVEASGHDPSVTQVLIVPGENPVNRTLSLSAVAAETQFLDAQQFHHVSLALSFIHPDLVNNTYGFNRPPWRIMFGIGRSSQILSFKVVGSHMLSTYRDGDMLGRVFHHVAEVDNTVTERYWSNVPGVYPARPGVRETISTADHWVKVHGIWYWIDS